MSIRKRVPAVAGGLGAVVLLGLAANFAIGGQHYNTPSHHSQKSAKAHNVIMLLGDGMGVSEVTAARYYQYGADGRMNMDRLPFTGFQTTWSVKPGFAPYKPDYDPDSASTGTMWATGEKTIDERVSQGPSSADTVPGDNLETVLEVARKAGKKTGNVTTAETHRRHAGCSRLTHLPAWLPGPERRTRDVPARDQGRRRSRLDHRADDRPQGRRPPRRWPRPLRAAAGRGWDDQRRRLRQGQGLPVRDRRHGHGGGQEQQAAARSLHPGQHDDRVERPDRDARRRHGGPALRHHQPPARRAEPRRHDDQGAEPAPGRQGWVLPAGRGRLDRQAGSRRQRVRADR